MTASPNLRSRLFAICVTVLLVCGGVGTAAAQPAPAVGDQAPGFTLMGLDEKLYSLAALRQKGPVLLVFWSTRCHFCHAMIPQFSRVQNEWGPRGLTLAAVDVGYEDAAEVEHYAQDNDIGYLILNQDDKKAELVHAYGLIGTPTIVLVSAQGAVLYYGHRLPDLDALLPAATAAAPQQS